MSATIELTEPVEGFEGVDYLIMRRPKVRDLLAMEKMKGGDSEKELKMFANLCEVEPKLIEGIDLADYLRMQKAYQGFLSSDPEKQDAGS